jgi:nitroreductase
MATQINSLWTVSEKDFPRQGAPREKLLFALTYAILAPSEYKSQPWRFRVGDNHVDLLADSGPDLLDPDSRKATMACGASLLHLRLALEHFGCSGKVEYERDLDEPERLARVHLGSGKAKEPSASDIFNAIHSRQANLSTFLPRDVAPDLTAELKRAAEREHAWLEVAEAETTRSRLAQIVEESQRKLFAFQNRSRASSHWSLEASGMRRMPVIAAPLAMAAIRWLGLDKSTLQPQIQPLGYSPLLAVLKTKIDDRRGWLQAGQALERVLLHAYARGLSVSFLSEPIQCEETRWQLQTAIGRRGVPQVMLRLGYADATTQPELTTRREAERAVR